MRKKEEEKRRVVDGRYRRKRWLKDDLVRSSLDVVVQQCLMDGPSGVEPTSRVGQRMWPSAFGRPYLNGLGAGVHSPPAGLIDDR